MEANEHDTVVPRALVVKIAENFRELVIMHQQEKAIMAEMIRGCIAKIKQPDDNGHWSFHASKVAREKLRTEKAQAWLHLEWLATQLENQSGARSPAVDLAGHEPILVKP